MTKRYAVFIELKSGKQVQTTMWCKTQEEALALHDQSVEYEDLVVKVGIKKSNTNKVRKFTDEERKRSKEREAANRNTPLR